ncbi:hypothetical protein Bbelb_201100 [Branchiostoma belcheri]|nr:hypothetical protein Bbelb_201100 [Branchiostoma belcheri]
MSAESRYGRSLGSALWKVRGIALWKVPWQRAVEGMRNRAMEGALSARCGMAVEEVCGSVVVGLRNNLLRRGLCAAKLLQESGLDVRVLEARDRVGGRTYTKRDPSYGYVDLGGSYVGPTQDRILRLAKELDLKTYVVDMKEKAVLYFEEPTMNYDTVYTSARVINPILIQERKIVGGAMQVSEKIAALLGDRVVLSSPVLRIDQEDTVAIVTTHSGQQYRLVQRMTMGSIIKTNTYYRTAFWKEKGFSGEAQSDIGPVSYCVDDTKPDGSHPAITGFILAGHARDVCEMSPEERMAATRGVKRILEWKPPGKRPLGRPRMRWTDGLKKILAKRTNISFEEAGEPVNYVEQNWMADPFSGGCFVATLGPGVLTSFGRAIRKPFGKVYFAGTETAVKWNGYMDGAVELARELQEKEDIRRPDLAGGAPSPDVPHTPFEDNPLEKILPSVPQFLYILLALAVLLLSVLWVYLF